MFKQRTKLAHRVAATSPAVKAASEVDSSRNTPPPPQFYNPSAVGGYPAAAPSPGLPQQQAQQVWQQPQSTPAPPQPQQQYTPNTQQWYSPQPQASVKPTPQNNNNTMNDAWNWGAQQWDTTSNNDDQYQQQQQFQKTSYQQASFNSQPQQAYRQPQPQQQQDSWGNWGWNQGDNSAWNWGSEDSSPSTDQSNDQPQNQINQPYMYQQSQDVSKENHYYAHQNQYQQPKEQANDHQYQQQVPEASSNEHQYPPTQYTNQYQPESIESKENQYQQYANYTQDSTDPNYQQHQYPNNYQNDLSSYEINNVSQQISDVSIQESTHESMNSTHRETGDTTEHVADQGVATGYSENQHQSIDKTETSDSRNEGQDLGRESVMSTYSENQRHSIASIESVDNKSREGTYSVESQQPCVESNEAYQENHVKQGAYNDLYANQSIDSMPESALVDQVITPAMENLQLQPENQAFGLNQESVDFENKEIVTPEGFIRATYGAEFGDKSRSASGDKVPVMVGVNLETVPDNIERPEDAVPLQPETPPPPPPPISQGHRVGVGHDDPCPWPSTIPPPENQEVTSVKHPLRPPLSSRHRATHSNSPPLPPPPALSPNPPQSVDPVSASDRNQFLETGQLSADISMYGRRQTIPGESRQSPEPGSNVRVIPGTTEPDLPESTRSETIGSDFGEPQREMRTNAEGINTDPQNRLRTNAEGTSPLQAAMTSRIVSVGTDNTEMRSTAEGTINEPRLRTNAEGTNNPVSQPPRLVPENARTSAEGTNAPLIPASVPRSVALDTRTNAEGTNHPAIQAPIPRSAALDTRTNAEGTNHPAIQAPIPRSAALDTRTNAEGTNHPAIQAPIPRSAALDTRTNAEGTNTPIIQPPRTETTRTSAEGTNEDRRNRNAKSVLTPTPRTSAFTEVRSTSTPRSNVEGSRTPRSNAEGVRSNVTSLRSSGEGDPSLASDDDGGDISDLENISSGELEKEDGELEESVEEKKKSPLQTRAVSAASNEVRPLSAGRRDRPRRDRGERTGSEERRSAERSRGKPPRPQDDKEWRRERDRDAQPRSRRHRYDDDSDSYHSERDDHRRRYRGDPRNKSPDHRHSHKSSRRTDYYRDRDEYARHRDYRHGYDKHYESRERDREHHYERERSRPSSRAGSEIRRDYESDQQERSSISGRSHRDHREQRDHRGPAPRDKPPSGQYYDRYRRDPREPRDPRDPYYRGGYDYYNRSYDYAAQQRAPPPTTTQPPMQHPEYNSYTYAYFVELRHSNPKAYDEWYRRYVATTSSQQGPGSGTFEGFPEDEHNSRGSVHSGRSSINDEIRYQQHLHLQRGRSPARSLREYASSPFHPHTPASLPPTYPNVYPYYKASYQTPSQAGSAANALNDSTSSPAPVQRLTPAKFSCAPTVAQMTVQGNLVHILPHYPRDRQVATVLLHDMTSLLAHDPMQAELRAFPGPLVKGTTHKNSVIQFCSQKIRNAQQDVEMFDRDSYILVWRLLILLLRQNGTVVGADIAELLLEDQQDSDAQTTRSASPHSHDGTEGESLTMPRMTEEQTTHKFRQYLLSGNTKEALDWAMKKGLWGHALFLASKLDQRTYNNVLIRFANGLTMNDPLQTLYQLMSGRLPAAVTSCADEKWGDWKPHLAMILSNPSQRPELDHKAITTLGDTLAGRGCLHASHFCYLLAQLEFGSYEQQPPAKLVLLGSPHTALPFECFANSEAIQCTEVYEYARRLADPTFYLPHFQAYKFLYAARLVEYGLPAEGLAYCEEISGTLIQHSGNGMGTFFLATQLSNLADSLKQIDPLFNHADGTVQEESAQFYASDPAWLTQLRQLLLTPVSTPALGEFDSMPDTRYSDGVVEYSALEYSQQQVTLDHNDTTAQDSMTYNEQWQYYYQQQQQWNQQQSQQTPEPIANNVSTEASENIPEQQVQENSGYWQPQNQWSAPEVATDDKVEGSTPQPPVDTPSNEPATSTPIQQQGQGYNYWDMQQQQSNNTEPEPAAAPSITLPGTRRQKTLSESSGSATSNHKPTSPKLANKKPAPTQSGQAGGGGWLGGLWSKISLKPKNQMILPDDKNPTIVWDAERKRWVNTDGDENDVGGGELKPPPKAPMATPAPVIPSNQSSVPSHNNQLPSSQVSAPSLPPSAGSGYKLSRAAMRKNYVNVLQPNGTSAAPKAAVAPDMFPSMVAPSAPVNFFVPAPVGDGEGTVFTTPASSAPQSAPQTTDSEHENTTSQQAGGIPMMYNPAQFTASQSNFEYQQ